MADVSTILMMDIKSALDNCQFLHGFEFETFADEHCFILKNEAKDEYRVCVTKEEA